MNKEQADIPAQVLTQNSPQRMPPIPPPTTLPPPSHLPSSSQVSQSGNVPDIIQYSQEKLEKGSTEEELVNPDVQISTSFANASATVIRPDIHSDREGTHVSIQQVERQNVEETFENQEPGIPTPENNRNDIHPSVPARIMSQNSPWRTTPTPPPTTPPPHLSNSSRGSQSGNVPDIIQYSQEIEKGSTEEELAKPDVQISTTFGNTSATIVPPGTHGNREGTHVQNVGETFDNQNVPPSVPAHIPPPTIPPPLLPSHLSSSSQVSQSGTIPDIIQLPGSTETISGKLECMCPGILLSRVLLYVCTIIINVAPFSFNNRTANIT